MNTGWFFGIHRWSEVSYSSACWALVPSARTTRWRRGCVQYSRSGVGCAHPQTLSTLYFHVARPTRRLYRLLYNIPDHLRDADRACGQCRRRQGHFVACWAAELFRRHFASAAHTHTARPQFVAVLKQDTYAVAPCRGFNSRRPPFRPNGAPELDSAPHSEPPPAAKLHTTTECAHAAPCTCPRTAHAIMKLSPRPRLARLRRTQPTTGAPRAIAKPTSSPRGARAEPPQPRNAICARALSISASPPRQMTSSNTALAGAAPVARTHAAAATCTRRSIAARGGDHTGAAPRPRHTARHTAPSR